VVQARAAWGAGLVSVTGGAGLSGDNERLHKTQDLGLEGGLDVTLGEGDGRREVELAVVERAEDGGQRVIAGGAKEGGGLGCEARRVVVGEPVEEALAAFDPGRPADGIGGGGTGSGVAPEGQEVFLTAEVARDQSPPGGCVHWGVSSTDGVLCATSSTQASRSRPTRSMTC